MSTVVDVQYLFYGISVREIIITQIMTSSQSNFTEGRIAAADGRFNGIRQVVEVVPMFLPTKAHWLNLANTIELVLPSAHPSPQPKRQMIRFTHFCTAHGKVSSGIPGHVLSPNNYCPFAWGSGPPSST